MAGHMLYVAPNGSGFHKAAANYALRYGIRCETLPFNASWDDFLMHLKGAAFVLIWNGNQSRGPLFENYCRAKGIPCAFLEYGMMDQDKTLFVDPLGFNGRSVLCGDLSWVTAEDTVHLEFVRGEYERKLDIRNEGFVLVPTQIEKDTQILYHTPFKTMTEFVEYIKRIMGPSVEIQVRPHPGITPQPLFHGVKTVGKKSAGSFLQHAARAASVVGLTSTCLLEAAVLGKPVLAMGDHPLRAHAPRDHDRVAAGALALRTSRANPDIASILERFNIRPLGCEPLKKGAA